MIESMNDGFDNSFVCSRNNSIWACGKPHFWNYIIVYITAKETLVLDYTKEINVKIKKKK